MPKPTPTQEECDLAQYGVVVMNKEADGSALEDPDAPPPAAPDQSEPPVLLSLSPSSAVSGDPDFVLRCRGANFGSGATIMFGEEDEPTTLVSSTEVTTGVKPSLFAPAVVPVFIRSGGKSSQVVDFTFTEPTATRHRRGGAS
jgi:hypothetical protein